MAGTKWTGTVPFDKVQIKEAFTKERFGIPKKFAMVVSVCLETYLLYAGA